MEFSIFFLAEDIRIASMEVDSFPNGVLKAHEKLHQLFADTFKLRYFGISWPGPDGRIIYKPALN